MDITKSFQSLLEEIRGSSDPNQILTKDLRAALIQVKNLLGKLDSVQQGDDADEYIII